MQTVKITIPQIGSHSTSFGDPAAVSLPCPPWGALDRDDRASTAPRSRMIKGSHDWKKDPVLRHASYRKDNG